MKLTLMIIVCKLLTTPVFLLGPLFSTACVRHILADPFMLKSLVLIGLLADACSQGDSSRVKLLIASMQSPKSKFTQPSHILALCQS